MFLNLNSSTLSLKAELPVIGLFVVYPLGYPMGYLLVYVKSLNEL